MQGWTGCSWGAVDGCNDILGVLDEEGGIWGHVPAVKGEVDAML
jgi:hypothetical protein